MRTKSHLPQRSKRLRQNLVVLFCIVGYCNLGSAQTLDAAPITQDVPPAQPVAVLQPPVAAPFTGIKWSGDIRYRLAQLQEDIDQQRKLQQMRVRLGLKAEVNEDVQAVIRLMTASSSISGNQTLGDSTDPGMVRRSFGLDLAFIDWHFLNYGEVWAGRTANPFWAPAKVQLVFDSDLAFEGVATRWNSSAEHFAPFASIAGYMISENFAAPKDSVDTGILGGDIGFVLKSKSWSLTSHYGNYYFLNIQNQPITSMDKDAKTDPYSYPFDRYKGNTVIVNDPLLPAADRKYYFEHRYILQEVGAEWKHQVGPIDYAVFFDWVKNDGRVTLNRGVEYGGSIKYKIFTIGEAYVRKDSDSVVAAFTDSDSNGGGTDSRGTRIFGSLQLGKNFVVNITKFEAKRGWSTVKRGFSMTFIDFAVSF